THERGVAAVARQRGLEASRMLIYIALRGRRRDAALACGAGVVAAYLAIALGAFGLFTGRGLPTDAVHLVVGDVKPGYDAAGKLAVGDRILAVDHAPLHGSPELVAAVNARGGAPVTLTIVRDGAERDVVIQPTRRDDHWLLGIVPRQRSERTTELAVALPAALRFPIERVVALARVVAPRRAADPGGPMRIVEEFAVTEPAWLMVTEQSLALAVYLWLALIVLDVVRAVRSRR
ncbi:MAG TPA: M50 family metallopeptidase, partial [Kofleriaceae bacterium]|nr:M50 family metallopeptidase [Kofleriaceae bacterium]